MQLCYTALVVNTKSYTAVQRCLLHFTNVMLSDAKKLPTTINIHDAPSINCVTSLVLKNEGTDSVRTDLTGVPGHEENGKNRRNRADI